MADDPTNRGPAARTRINIHQEHEVAWWTKSLGCTRAQLVDCVKRVGVMVVDVKRCLGSK